METYPTMCKIDNQQEFAVCLRKLKQGFCISLGVWGGEGDGKGMSLCGAPPCRLCLKWIWWEAKIVLLWSQIGHEPRFFLGRAKAAALVEMCGARVRSKPGLLLGYDEVASLAGRGRGWSRA